MHELGVAQKILEISEKEVSSRKLTNPVEKVTLRVGRLKSIIPDSLTFHFDILKREKPQFEATVLEIQEIPITVFCSICNQTSTVDSPSFFCERCQSPVAIRSGEELSIESIDVADSS